jgi:hypothetical protein
VQFVVNRVVAELLQPSKNKLRNEAIRQAEMTIQQQIEAAFGSVSISEVQ